VKQYLVKAKRRRPRQRVWQPGIGALYLPIALTHMFFFALFVGRAACAKLHFSGRIAGRQQLQRRRPRQRVWQPVIGALYLSISLTHMFFFALFVGRAAEAKLHFSGRIAGRQQLRRRRPRQRLWRRVIGALYLSMSLPKCVSSHSL